MGGTAHVSFLNVTDDDPADVAISVAAHRSSTHDWDAIVPALGTQRQYSGDTAPGGRFLLELLDVVARTLSDDAVNLEQMVHGRTSDLGSGIDLTQSIEPGETEKLTSKSRRRIMETYREHGPILSAVRHEMPAMLGVVSETSGVLGSLVNDDDRVDIKQDSSAAAVSSSRRSWRSTSRTSTSTRGT